MIFSDTLKKSSRYYVIVGIIKFIILFPCFLYAADYLHLRYPFRRFMVLAVIAIQPLFDFANAVLMKKLEKSFFAYDMEVCRRIAEVEKKIGS